MSEWVLETSDRYERDFKHYEKKHPLELSAALNNLESYLLALRQGIGPQFIHAGYIHHHYPKGIKSLDQKGGGQKQKLKQVRLYIYPNEARQLLHLLAIGDKTAQKEDVRECVSLVKRIIGDANNG